MKKAINAHIHDIIAKELAITDHLTERRESHLSKSDTRRAVEDLHEVRRYKEMHGDFEFAEEF
jgi:hypothetical protein